MVRRRARRRCGPLSVALLLLAGGCQGYIGELGADAPADDGGSTSWSAASCHPGQPMTPAPADPQRLSAREYRATVEALVGTKLPGLSSLLPKDPLSHGFDNQADKLALTMTIASNFFDAAEHVAKKLATDSALLRSVMGCDLSAAARDACIEKLIVSFGRRAFRRPLTGGDGSTPPAGSEVGRLLALAKKVRGQAAAAATNPYGANADVAAVVTALLTSPHFVVRVTAGKPIADRPGVRRLDGYELATRLSYLLWGVGPDDKLLAAAAAGNLASASGIAAQARRLLADPRAKTHLHDFFHQWLHLGTVFKGNLDTKLFPEYGSALQKAMYEEMRRLIADHFWPAKADLMKLFTARYTYVDATLAKLYGVTAPASGGYARVAFAPSAKRAGLVSTAGVLAMTSHPTEASLVNRGLFVRETLLCKEIPPPPPNVPDVEPKADESPGSAQDRHTTDPKCKACHELIDPIGNGLEAYDALGKLRPAKARSKARELPHYIKGIDDSSFFGGAELGEILARRPEVRRCIVGNLVRWGLGRGIYTKANGDVCSAEKIDERFADSGNRFHELIVALATSSSFREKRVSGKDASCR